jgi:hypothetical protein
MMGALLIYPHGDFEVEDKAKGVMMRRGFSEQVSVDSDHYRILLYKKTSGMDSLSIVSGKQRLLVSGTLIYKGYGLVRSCEEVLGDLISGRLNEGELLGHFVAVALLNDRIVVVLTVILRCHYIVVVILK